MNQSWGAVLAHNKFTQLSGLINAINGPLPRIAEEYQAQHPEVKFFEVHHTSMGSLAITDTVAQGLQGLNALAAELQVELGGYIYAQEDREGNILGYEFKALPSEDKIIRINSGPEAQDFIDFLNNNYVSYKELKIMEITTALQSNSQIDVDKVLREFRDVLEKEDSIDSLSKELKALFNDAGIEFKDIKTESELIRSLAKELDPHQTPMRPVLGYLNPSYIKEVCQKDVNDLDPKDYTLIAQDLVQGKRQAFAGTEFLKFTASGAIDRVGILSSGLYIDVHVHPISVAAPIAQASVQGYFWDQATLVKALKDPESLSNIKKAILDFDISINGLRAVLSKEDLRIEDLHGICRNMCQDFLANCVSYNNDPGDLKLLKTILRKVLTQAPIHRLKLEQLAVMIEAYQASPADTPIPSHLVEQVSNLGFKKGTFYPSFDDLDFAKNMNRHPNSSFSRSVLLISNCFGHIFVQESNDGALELSTFTSGRSCHNYKTDIWRNDNKYCSEQGIELRVVGSLSRGYQFCQYKMLSDKPDEAIYVTDSTFNELYCAVDLVGYTPEKIEEIKGRCKELGTDFRHDNLRGRDKLMVNIGVGLPFSLIVGDPVNPIIKKYLEEITLES